MGVIDLVAGFYFWLILILVGSLTLIGILLFARRTMASRPATVPPSAQPRRSTSRAPKGNSMADKLGDRLVQIMIQISSELNRDKLESLINDIKKECSKLIQDEAIPEENKKIISTVQVWANGFDIEKHMAEMAIAQQSSQIVYDARRRDFRLMITREV